ncbi:MAG: hypothetical protein KDB23_16400, partial [Planctomycetales bacterium]|nr:hypothetical protein [Planctomycetales bacterium]
MSRHQRDGFGFGRAFGLAASPNTIRRNRRRGSISKLRSVETLESRQLLAVDTQLITPLGSLIERTTSNDQISVAAEVDTISLQLDIGQRVSVAVRPDATLQPTIELVNATNSVVATASAASAGGPAVFDSAITSLGGNYTLRISGVGSSTGDYTADIYLNAAIEAESITGVSNDSAATAQSIDGNFIELGGGLAQRAAVVGTRDPDLLESFETPLSPSEWTVFSSDPNGIVYVTPDFGSADGTSALIMGRQTNGPLTLNQATWKVDLSGVTAATLKFSYADFLDEETVLPASFTGNANGDGVSISTNGNNWFRILQPVNLINGQWKAESIDLIAAATNAGIALDSDFYIRFQQYDDGAFSGDGRGYDAIRIDTTPVKPVSDWYSINLSDGDYVSLNMATVGQAAGFYGSIHLYDAGLNLLATSSQTAELQQAISNFRDATVNTALDTYFIEISDPSPEYSLIVTRDADVDREQNDSFLSAQLLEGPLQSIGYVSDISVGTLQERSSFTGPDYTGFIPPDPSAAAGPTQLVTVVNTQIAIYDKSTGSQLFEEDLSGENGFFGLLGATEAVFDPWVLFDTLSDRFFVVGIEISSVEDSSVYLAVSTTSTPTNGTEWHKYRFDFAHDPQGLGFGLGAHFPDYEKIATNADALFVSANYFPIFNGTGNYAGITAFDKASLLAGLPPTKLYEEYFAGSTVFPLQSVESSSGAQYFAEQRPNNTIRLHAISDVLTNPQRASMDLSVPAFNEPVL